MLRGILQNCTTISQNLKRLYLKSTDKVTYIARPSTKTRNVYSRATLSRFNCTISQLSSQQSLSVSMPCLNVMYSSNELAYRCVNLYTLFTLCTSNACSNMPACGFHIQTCMHVYIYIYTYIYIHIYIHTNIFSIFSKPIVKHTITHTD